MYSSRQSICHYWQVVVIVFMLVVVVVVTAADCRPKQQQEPTQAPFVCQAECARRFRYGIAPTNCQHKC